MDWAAAARRVALPPARFALRLWRRLDERIRPPRAWDGEHHPVIARVPPWSGEADGRFLYDFLGCRTDPKFRGHRPQPAGPLTTRVPSPWPGYFELVFVLESVVEAAGARRYRAVELGAGYGPWLVTAWKAMRRVAPVPVHLIGVEMVTEHFAWLGEHLRNNGIDPAAHVLVHAAVSDRRGTGSYGSASADEAYGRGLTAAADAPGGARVETVTLPDLLHDVEHVDLLHLDVQGEELRVLRHAADEIDRKVRRVIFGTHSRRNHRETHELFRERGWSAVYDFGVRARARTPYGDMRFRDGLQAWCNPKLTPSPRPS